MSEPSMLSLTLLWLLRPNLKMVEKQDGISLDPWHCSGSDSSESCSRLSVRGKPTRRNHVTRGFVCLFLQHHLAFSDLYPPWRHLTLPTFLGSKLSQFSCYFFNFIFSTLKILFPSPGLKILEIFSFSAWIFFSFYSVFLYQLPYDKDSQIYISSPLFFPKL